MPWEWHAWSVLANHTCSERHCSETRSIHHQTSEGFSSRLRRSPGGTSYRLAPGPQPGVLFDDSFDKTEIRQHFGCGFVQDRMPGQGANSARGTSTKAVQRMRGMCGTERSGSLDHGIVIQQQVEVERPGSVPKPSHPQMQLYPLQLHQDFSGSQVRFEPGDCVEEVRLIGESNRVRFGGSRRSSIDRRGSAMRQWPNAPLLRDRPNSSQCL